MHYPWWYVPFAGSPMLIAAIATVHVLVSHYAVGGGLFLAVETRFAYRSRNQAYLAYLKRHALFFVLLTVVFGAVTGVGIWWTIGLASPLATETLIQTFVFGWAIEYVFFLLEIASAFAFYYYWGRLKPETHQSMAWIYAVSAWMSLVLITGITAFMLNPGGWPAHRTFWAAFFNPQFIPQTLARTGGALMLSSLYVYLHASLTLRDTELCHLVEKRSARPALLGAVLTTIGGIGWYAFLPPSARAALAAASVLNILMVIIFALTAAVFIMFYFGPYRNPHWLSPGFAIMFFAFGLAAVATGEFIREAVRKPFVVYNVVLANQILPEEIGPCRQKGFLESGVWTRAFVEKRAPQAVGESRIDEQRLLALPQAERVRIGQAIFLHHCNDCHAPDAGYAPVSHLIRGWSRDTILYTVKHPEEIQFFMPPWAGTAAEADLLTDYLAAIAPPFPSGMRLDGETR